MLAALNGLNNVSKPFVHLTAFVADNAVTVYTPTANDLLYLENAKFIYPDLATDEGKLANLVRRIYTFDYYYDYSDDGAVWRAADARRKDITEELKQMKDRDAATFLETCRNEKTKENLLSGFPWLVMSPNNFQYCKLVRDGIEPENAAMLIGVTTWINALRYATSTAGGWGSVVWASDIGAATVYHRNTGVAGRWDDIIGTVTIPDDLFHKWGKVARFLDHKGIYALLKPLLALGISYQDSWAVYDVDNIWLMV